MKKDFYHNFSKGLCNRHGMLLENVSKGTDLEGTRIKACVFFCFLNTALVLLWSQIASLKNCEGILGIKGEVYAHQPPARQQGRLGNKWTICSVPFECVH